MQLVDSDWPANILAGSHFRAQETRALSPDGVCALARAQLGTRLIHTNTLSSNPPTSIHKTSSNKSIPLSEQKTVDIS